MAKRKKEKIKKGMGRRAEPWGPNGSGPNGWMNRELKDLHEEVTPIPHHKKSSFFNRRANQYTTACASILLKAIDLCHVQPIKAHMAGYLNANAITTFRGKPWTRQNIYQLLDKTHTRQYVDDSKETYEMREAAIVNGWLESPESE